MIDPNADDSRDPGAPPPPGIDADVPHPARIWNYWLGGHDWFKADRLAGERIGREFPHVPQFARAQRAFLVRAVRYLTGPARIRQFLDLGSGLPAGGNTHEIAQRIAADTGIVYVDDDPVVLAHAKALLEAAREADAGFGAPGVGVTPAAIAAGMHARPAGASGVATPVLRAGPVNYVDADLRDVEAVLRGAAGTLDFGRPVAVIMLGVLGCIPDHDAACSIVRRVMAALPSGSYLAVADGVSTSDAVTRAQLRFNAGAREAGDYRVSAGYRPADAYQLRRPEEIAAYCDGLELVAPGVVPCAEWKPDPVGTAPARGGDTPVYAAVARKP